MKIQLVVFIFVLVSALAALPGCGGTSSDPSMQTNRLVGTAWELSLVQTPGRERLPVTQPGDYRIAFVEENRLVVQVLNNKCVGHYNSTGGSLSFRRITEQQLQQLLQQPEG